MWPREALPLKRRGSPMNPPTQSKYSRTFLVTCRLLITVTDASHKQLKRKKGLFCSWLQLITRGHSAGIAGIMGNRKQSGREGSLGQDARQTDRLLPPANFHSPHSLA